MYMGVIPYLKFGKLKLEGAPHVYGGDPYDVVLMGYGIKCSPCIWG